MTTTNNNNGPQQQQDNSINQGLAYKTLQYAHRRLHTIPHTSESEGVKLWTSHRSLAIANTIKLYRTIKSTTTTATTNNNINNTVPPTSEAAVIHDFFCRRGTHQPITCTISPKFASLRSSTTADDQFIPQGQPGAMAQIISFFNI